MKKIIYITGLNGSVNDGIGIFLRENYTLYSYLELNTTFNSLKHSEQISVLKEWLKPKLKETDCIIAVSYGAYILLHSFEEIIVRNKTTLVLISPVLGLVKSNKGGRVPPGARYLSNCIQNKSINIPIQAYLLTGSDDPICNLDSAINFCEYYPSVELNIFKNEAHNISKHKLQKTLSNIINNEA